VMEDCDVIRHRTCGMLVLVYCKQKDFRRYQLICIKDIIRKGILCCFCISLGSADAVAMRLPRSSKYSLLDLHPSLQASSEMQFAPLGRDGARPRLSVTSCDHDPRLNTLTAVLAVTRSWRPLCATPAAIVTMVQSLRSL
jgi:hypothetical protein